MSQTESFGAKPSVFARFFGDIFNMPIWQKGFLALATALGGAGVAGQTYSKFSPQQQPVVNTQNAPAAVTPSESSGFVDERRVPNPPPDPAAPDAQTEPGLVQYNSPWMTRVGLSFVGGFIIGWAFRVFIKTMMLVTVLGVALLVGLSYFHVVNVDFSAARVKYADSIEWVIDQAAKLRDAAMTYLPSTSTGVAGLFVGVKRK
ncbi:hypothetical protein BH10PLA1_BH10PLA1_18310 [soil metagenome]